MDSPTVHADVAFRRVGEEVVLVNLVTNEIFALNETGARFWELLAEGHTRAEIVATLAVEFDVGEAQVDAEATALIEQLGKAGMLAGS